MSRLIAIDPGHHKCGLLMADLTKSLVLDGKVVDKSSVINLLSLWINEYTSQQMALRRYPTHVASEIF